jgi:phosphatidate cytidylyltransferase
LPTAPAIPATTPASKNRNLVLRVATAAVLLPVVLWLIWLGGLPFALMAAAAAAANASELAAMARLPSALRPLAIAGAFAMPWFFAGVGLDSSGVQALWAGLAVASLAVRMFRVPTVEGAGDDVSRAVFAAVYGALIGYVVPLRLLGPSSSWSGAGWVLLACATTWGGDTGAYFAGRAFGRRKLFPRISPAKTWEGFFGGLASSIAAALLVRTLALPQLSATDACLLGVIGGIGGPVGDLVESMLKRAWGVKDSGKLLPGHGGMLDRVDALMVNVPLVLLYARWVAVAR